MDITALGSYYLNDTRLMPGSLGIANQDGGRPEIEGAFSGLLEKALSAGEEQKNSAAKPETSETPVIPKMAGKPVVDKTDKLYEQCEALETFLVKNILSGMRKTIQKSDFMGGGFAGEMYEDMLYDEYAKDLTKNGGFGLADLAYLELTGQRGKVINTPV
ncbi:rod-binding protein [Breznakiella homolactica]|uniref:Rod-binding protein n=1 Tax=Breznakiella homolactica TaxID=2798577 RepID=A0A7T8B929_9SPIR|nr:rod-binding protein [Breznakiella homolactica]QQO08027.1 rod-binding protein [Breznakiella homolactica]